MKTIFPISISLLLVISLSNCNGQSTSFKHNLKSKTLPWSSEPKTRTSNQFTFAVISDLNSGERAGIFEIAMEQINLLKPDFILSIGDLINGGTEDTVKLKKEFDSFDQRVTKAGAPFFHLGGNHDLTNPAMRKYWGHRYGRRYYHFVYNQVLFLMIDSEDYSEKRMQEIYVARKRAIELLDSGKTEQANKSAYFQMPERMSGEISSEQSTYFEKVIADNPNVRWTFILMHKPVWKREGAGNLSRIEKALSKNNYTVINGHLHAYSYTLKDNHDYIMLGTTGGGQDAKNKNSFDHITWVSFIDNQPSIANLRLDGILDKTGKIPLDGEKYCFQASKCEEPKK
ncbi:MAG: metallophosphoesterase [Bacteroidetes bacterium]|nr:metallophosphoesterase [Bacteroidota bacterium]